jgi:exodeoxyribonuclease V alpha subunit
MVTQNDYNLGLFNGDVGLIMPDSEKQQSLRAFFRDEYGSLRHIAPSLLPGHETVFAMTVHKSQGSEFNRVLLILPDRDSPLLTRELLYTAITRAREKVEIWGRKAIFASAVKRQIKRTSGLAEALWGEYI